MNCDIKEYSGTSYHDYDIKEYLKYKNSGEKNGIYNESDYKKIENYINCLMAIIELEIAQLSINNKGEDRLKDKARTNAIIRVKRYFNELAGLFDNGRYKKIDRYTELLLLIKKDYEGFKLYSGTEHLLSNILPKSQALPKLPANSLPVPSNIPDVTVTHSRKPHIGPIVPVNKDEQAWETVQQNDFINAGLVNDIAKPIKRDLKDVTVYEIQGNGACFFNAVLHQIARRKNFESLRNSVINLLKDPPDWKKVENHTCGFKVNIPTYHEKGSRKWVNFTYPHRLRHHAFYKTLIDCNNSNKASDDLDIKSLREFIESDNIMSKTFENYGLNNSYAQEDMVISTAFLLKININVHRSTDDTVREFNTKSKNKIHIFHNVDKISDNNNHYESYFEKGSYDNRDISKKYEKLFLVTSPKIVTHPPPKKISQQKILHVLTYNILNDANFNNKNITDRYKEICKKLNVSNIHILCLQEVVYNQIKIIENNLKNYKLVSSCVDWLSESNVIFCLKDIDSEALSINVDYNVTEIDDRRNSRYGRYKNKSKEDCIDRSVNAYHEYTKSTCINDKYESSGGGARCFAGVKINYNGKNVYVYNSHFLPPFMNLISNSKPIPQTKDHSKFNMFRIGQMNEIMEHFDNISDPSKIGIIAGDFNANYKDLKNVFSQNKGSYKLFDKWVYNHNGVSVTGINTGKNIDYIITNKAKYHSELYDKIIKKDNLSDHLPVLSYVTIE